MEPLFDSRGKTAAFLRGERIISPSGKSLAWINENGVIYDYNGRHLGWWQDNHMRAKDGGVVVWQRQYQNLGVIPPIPEIPPIPPIPDIPPFRSFPELPPIKPMNLMNWSGYRFPG